MKISKEPGNNYNHQMGSASEGKAMFPRLHVKETKPAGPRAPPRNKMALYEQFSIPSNRYASQTANARHSSPHQQQVACDPRLVYPPYYVSPGSYVPMNFHGQFMSHGPISGSNNALTESGRSNFGPSKSREASSDMIVQSHLRVSRPQSTQNSHSSRDESKVLSHQQSCNPRTNDPESNTSLGNSRVHKTGNASAEPQRGINLEDLPMLPEHTDGSMSHKAVPAVSTFKVGPRDKKTELSRTLFQSTEADVHKRGRLSDKCSPEETVDCEDNFMNKHSGTSDSIQDSKCADRCSSKLNGQIVRHDSKAEEPLKDGSTCAESVYKGEKSLRGSQNVSNSSHVKGSNQSRHSVKEINNSQTRSDCYSRVFLSPFIFGKGDNSDHNSESSMVDSIHTYDINPKNVISAIGQKEFWRLRKAILRQQKIFSTQVFELHRLVKVQKLIAMSPNLLIEDAAFENVGGCTTEQQVPRIDPENFQRISPINSSESPASREKPNTREGQADSCAPSQRNHIFESQEGRDHTHSTSFPGSNFVPAPGSAWGYPAFSQNALVPSHPGGYGFYPPYMYNPVGGPGTVMGVPCMESGGHLNTGNAHEYKHQSPCPPQYQPYPATPYSKYPYPHGMCYDASTMATPLAPGKTLHSVCESAPQERNSPREEVSASVGYESGTRQIKQRTEISGERSSNLHHLQDTVTRVASTEDQQRIVEKENYSTHNKFEGTMSKQALANQEQNNNTKKNESITTMPWRFSTNSRSHASCKPMEVNENGIETHASSNFENLALSLFPMSSSISSSSEMAMNGSFRSNERVRVIKAVPRTAMAASETTADILLSLQRERKQ